MSYFNEDSRIPRGNNRGFGEGVRIPCGKGTHLLPITRLPSVARFFKLNSGCTRRQVICGWVAGSWRGGVA